MSDLIPDLDAVIGENLRILTQAMGEICQRSTLEEAAQGAVTANQFTILRILARQPGLAAKGFARILNISPAAVSKNLDHLVELGLVARDPHPSDRRSATLVLQEPGRELLQRFDRIATGKISGILAHFTTEEKVQLLDHVRRIIRFTLSSEQDVEAICYQCGGRCGDDCVIEHRQGACALKGEQGD